MKTSMRMRNAAWIRPVLAGLVLAATAVAARAQARDALAGASWTFSGDEGKTFAPTLATTAAKAMPVVARASFGVDDVSGCGGLRLTPSAGLAGGKVTINGKAAVGPLAGMSYTAVPMDPQKYLVKGVNVLEVAGTYTGDGQPVQAAKVAPKLEVYGNDTVGVQSGPSLGAIGADWFSVVCRTNIPATVTVTAKSADPAGAETTATSARGYYHRLKVPLAAGTKAFTYSVTSQAGPARKTEGPFAVKSPWGDPKGFRFVATGDCRTHRERWTAVAEAVRKAEPSLVLFTGDLVSSGTSDALWDVEFFGPAKAMLASCPLYPVIGNHEGDAAAYDEMTFTAGLDGKAADGRGRNWAQTVGSVLFIGIDGTKGWAADGPELKWLEGVLKDSKARYIFAEDHYPGWTSGYRAKTLEPAMKVSRELILPLLAKYGATAMIVGHDHNYERCEIPAGVCGSANPIVSITSGGAGAPLRGKGRNAEKYNSYSKAFFAGLHYCVLEVTEESCTMKVYAVPGGEVVDEATFKPRQ